MKNNIIGFLSSVFNREKSTISLTQDMEAFKEYFWFSAGRSEIEDTVIMLLDDSDAVVSLFDMEGSAPADDFIGSVINLDKYEWTESGEGVMESTVASKDGKYRLKLMKIRGLTEDTALVMVSSLENQDDPDSLFVDICQGFFTTCGIFTRHKDNSLLLKALDSTDEGISLCDRDGHLRFINRSACEILDISKEELLNKDVGTFSKEEPMLTKILKEKKSLIDKEYFLKFRNKTVQLINSGYPIFDDEGNIQGAIDIYRSIERSRILANTLAGQHAFFTFDNMVGESMKIDEVIKLAKKYALSNENILIIGDSGTGKELMAQSIHNYSNRKDKPFIALNCANFPDELIDSELFGYEEGTFTGAIKGGKPGKFEMAEGGTLFLDEIGEMPIHLQAKLLRVLETRSIYRLGGQKPISVDVRVLAATNRDLKVRVEEKKFREDLYYRLNVLYLEIPSLNEREDDILHLADHFIKNFIHSTGKKIRGLTEESKKMLMNHDWKGNVRELENIISRAMFISEEEVIGKSTLLKAGLEETVDDDNIVINRIIFTRDQVVKTLKENGGNKKRTAEILGISRPTLYRILKEK